MTDKLFKKIDNDCVEITATHRISLHELRLEIEYLERSIADDTKRLTELKHNLSQYQEK